MLDTSESKYILMEDRIGHAEIQHGRPIFSQTTAVWGLFPYTLESNPMTTKSLSLSNLDLMYKL